MLEKKSFIALALAGVVAACAPVPAGFSFGDDTSVYANDGECDDRRFRGPGMALSLDTENNGRDATDCRNLLNQGQVQIFNLNEARAATQCNAIQWGNNTSSYVGNGVCDDPRFEGPGTHPILFYSDLGRDARECRSLCEAGQIALRNY